MNIVETVKLEGSDQKANQDHHLELARDLNVL